MLKLVVATLLLAVFAKAAVQYCADNEKVHSVEAKCKEKTIEGHLRDRRQRVQEGVLLHEHAGWSIQL